MPPRSYSYYRDLLRGRALPAAYVDLDALDANVAAVLRRAGGTPVRIATKSVRCVAVLSRIQRADPGFRGLLCYSAAEAVHLAGSGFDDLVVGYPAWNEAQVREVCAAIRRGSRITLMVDCPEHVTHLAALAREEDVVLPLCLDADMSSHLPGLHFGVRRSPIDSVATAIACVERIEAQAHVALDGVMGYEAQIAGLADAVPGRRGRSFLVRLLKRRSRREVAERRAAIVGAIQARGHRLRFVNGGGTGSIETTRAEPCVTEVAAGSAFFAPTLFDGYRGFRHQPSAGFAVEITRQPAPGIWTCLGGGYVASGAAGAEKLPSPWLPSGAALLPDEGAGEVQTPVVYHGPETLALGDPILFRHAKAGELCERFERLLLVSDGRVVDEVPTYRGEGRCFF